MLLPPATSVSPLTFGLPYESWRPGQLEAIKYALASGKRFNLLELATGVGKSAIPAALQHVLEQRVVVLTSTKALQSQYLRDFPYALTLKGRNNYPCPRLPSLTADYCTHHIKPCSMLQICPYMVAKVKATTSTSLVILNTSYFLYEANYVGAFSDNSHVVIDEAHLLERELMSFLEISLSKTRVDLLALNPPAYKTKPESWAAWATYAVSKIDKNIEDLKLIEILDGKESEFTTEDAKFIQESKVLTQLKAKLQFLAEVVDHTWIFDQTEYQWVFKPIWVNKYAEFRLWKFMKTAILMSATLSPENCPKALGIEEEFGFFSCQSPFRIENRRVYFVPAANMNSAKSDSNMNSAKIDWSKGVAALDSLLEKLPNFKILCHTSSYALAHFILDNSKYRNRLLTHTTGNREAVLNNFRNSPKPLVLVSPSMTSGVSFEDDTCRIVIVMKLPFPDLGDKQVSQRFFRDRKSYSYWTSVDIAQSTGRACRSMTDWSISFILDSNFDWMYRRNEEMFPLWWRRGVVLCGSIEEALDKALPGKT